MKKAKQGDINQAGKSIVELATSQEQQKNPAAVELGRLGGKKGGPARARRLTAAQRSEIARGAALKRWGK